jgi:predicted kinase
MVMTFENKTPTIIFLCGCPACGKSTWVKNNYKTLTDFKLISTDIWLEDKAKELNKQFTEIFNDYIGEALNYFLESLKELTDKKNNIIIDQTNYTLSSRKKKLIYCEDYYKIAVYFELDKQEAIVRNCNRERSTPRYVLESYFEHYNRPSLDEGFNQIINGHEQPFIEGPIYKPV